MNMPPQSRSGPSLGPKALTAIAEGEALISPLDERARRFGQKRETYKEFAQRVALIAVEEIATASESVSPELETTIKAIDAAWCEAYGAAEQSATPTAARNRVTLLAKAVLCAQENFRVTNKAYCEQNVELRALQASPSSERSQEGRIPELEPTRINAEYWLNSARNSDSHGLADSALVCAEQAINAWKNAAYAAWDKINAAPSATSAQYDPSNGKCYGDCDCSIGQTCKAYLVYRAKAEGAAK